MGSNLARSTIPSLAFNFLGTHPHQILNIKTKLTIAKVEEMESVKSSGKLSIRKAKLLGIVFLAYSIVLPFIILLIPESELPVGTGPSVVSWLMILLMPIEILLIYVFYHVFYRHFGKKSKLGNIMGPAVLMYTLATIPSVYAFVIGFTDPALRLIAIPLGLTFSLVGFWLAWMFVSNLWENRFVSDSDYY